VAGDKIQLAGMVFYGYHGVRLAERELGQRFIVDLEIETDLSRAGRTDSLADTVSYSSLYTLVKEIMEEGSRSLLESLAETIAGLILDRFEVDAVHVTVKKPQVPIQGSVMAYAAVEITRRR
jgi:dihydroneopterin aldolase